jgi:toxin ParE1/3/4
MTRRVTLSPRAQGDLDAIWDYTAAAWDDDQAEQYVRQLWQHIQMIAENPSIGLARPDIRAGYYGYPSGTHVLFYRVLDGVVDIVRILHQRMDGTQHL